METVVYYHDDLDGFGAAYSAWLKLGYLGVEYVPVRHGEDDSPLRADDKGKKIICCDMFIQQIPDSFSTDVLVIDHHPQTIKASEKYLDNYTFVVDNDRSAAFIAYEHFNKSEKIALWAMLIDDYDTWRHQHELTKPFIIALNLAPRIFESWQKILATSDSMNEMVERGMSMLMLQADVVRSLIKKARLCMIAGVEVLAVNTSVFPNEVCDTLLTEDNCDVVACYHDDPALHGRKWSLRSKPGGIDVSELVAPFGGGGHACAAAFVEHRAVDFAN